MYGIWYILTNQVQKEWVLLNVEYFIMEYGLIHMGKRTMICLHTFQDDVSRWKELLVNVAP
jgi:hypothetical protein